VSARREVFRFGQGGPSRNLGVALADGLRQCFRAVYHASPSEGGRGHEAGAPTAYVDDARALDPEAGFAERGAEFGRRKRRLLLEGMHRCCPQPGSRANNRPTCT
jgi:hypothetical protein